MDGANMQGTWFLSAEESSEDVLIFRGRHYDFPRTRAPRKALTINPDGSAVYYFPSSVDSHVQSPGSWNVVDNKIVMKIAGASQVYRVDHFSRDVLVMKKMTEGERYGRQ
ncbi:hypothetical protein [Kocuria sabuli]|uniref:hypothetical protein n=1 Tax=Kocuria sabuli TaxID=3071448 RepID=UPI0034D74432